VHVADRLKMTEDYQRQVQLLFKQWETDLDKIRENEEKLQVVALQLFV